MPQADRSPHTECRDCTAPITWMVTRGGKKIAVERESVPLDWDEQEPYDKATMKCHWDSCPAKAG